MQCPRCDARFDDGPRSCPRCGYSLPPLHVTRLEFRGTVLEVVGRILLMFVATLFIIPGPWAFAAVCRWFCRNLRFTGGITATFPGRGGEIAGWWWLCLFTGGLKLFPIHVGIGTIRVHPTFDNWPAECAYDALMFLIAAFATIQIVRWCVCGVHLSSVARLRFQGGYWALVGWYVLNSLMLLTIIGWAWSLAATYRWLARNARATDVELQFHGRGSQVLWRVVVTALLSVLIVPIPWAWLWYTRWLVASTSIQGELGEPSVHQRPG